MGCSLCCVGTKYSNAAGVFLCCKSNRPNIVVCELFQFSSHTEMFKNSGGTDVFDPLVAAPPAVLRMICHPNQTCTLCLTCTASLFVTSVHSLPQQQKRHNRTVYLFLVIILLFMMHLSAGANIILSLWFIVFSLLTFLYHQVLLQCTDDVVCAWYLCLLYVFQRSAAGSSADTNVHECFAPRPVHLLVMH